MCYNDYFLCDICKCKSTWIAKSRMVDNILYYELYDKYENYFHKYIITKNFNLVKITNICDKCIEKLLDQKKLKNIEFIFEGSIDTLFDDYPKIKLIYINFLTKYLKENCTIRSEINFIINFLYSNKNNLDLINHEIIVNEIKNNFIKNKS